jgi:hypothetical protein
MRKHQPFLAQMAGNVTVDTTAETNQELTDHIAATAAFGHSAGVGLHTHQAPIEGGLLDHGLALSGLEDDDHLQYFRVDGVRGMSGHVLPTLPDTYDLGSSTLLWRKGWLSEMDAVLFAENTISVIGGWFYITKDQGALVAALPAAAVTYDFGKTMTPNDFVVFRAALMVEYIRIGTLVSGTTYNITRNLDGTGANDWPAGAVYAVLGAPGQGRIELNAYDTPRISIIEQGATYNAQTERIRLGDLAAWQAAGLTGYGMAMGDFAGGEYLYYTSGSGLVIRGTVRADDGYLGNLTISGTMRTGVSPNPRIELSGSQLAGYSNAATRQFWLNASDGKAYAGLGNIVLDSTGITVYGHSVDFFRDSSQSIHGWLVMEDREASNMLNLVRYGGFSNQYTRIGLTGTDIRFYLDDSEVATLTSTGFPRFVPIDPPITSSTFNGNAFSTTGKTAITVSTAFSGVPSNAKALYCRVSVRDSGSANNANVWFGLSSNTTGGVFHIGVSPRGLPNDYYSEEDGICPVTANGLIYYQVSASGTATMDVVITVCGYFI